VAFAVNRDWDGPLVVAWREGDAFAGEEDAPVPVELPWPPGEVVGGRLRLNLSVTPVFLRRPPLADPARAGPRPV
jgi:hypothetical protein